MILVANGCSHTAGAELEFPQQGQCYEKAWPKHLGEMLGYDSINLSMSGASNHRVVRTTFEYLHKHYVENNGSFDDLFFVILWPGMFRTEIYNATDTSKRQYYDNNWCPLVTGNDKGYKQTLSSGDYTYYRSWVTTMTLHQMSIDFQLAVIQLQTMFQKYGIKYVFWNASCTGFSRQPEYEPYALHINPKRYPKMYDTSFCFTELCDKSNQKIAQPSIESGFASHYDEDAHRWFADFIFNYISKNKLL